MWNCFIKVECLQQIRWPPSPWISCSLIVTLHDLVNLRQSTKCQIWCTRKSMNWHHELMEHNNATEHGLRTDTSRAFTYESKMLKTEHAHFLAYVWCNDVGGSWLSCYESCYYCVPPWPSFKSHAPFLASILCFRELEPELEAEAPSRANTNLSNTSKSYHVDMKPND